MNFLIATSLGLLFMMAVFALFSHFLGKRIDAALPATGKFAEVDGERIHYRELGQGPAIVLVHGLSGNLRNFGYLPLKELARDYRLVLIDRPGSGQSPRGDDGKAGIAAQARLVAGFIRAMQFERPPLLVGHSLGGAIALGLALEQPRAVAGLALIAPLTHFIPQPPVPFRALAIRSPGWRRLFAQVFAAPLGVLGTRMVLKYIFGPEPTPRDFMLRGGGLLSLRPGAFYGSSTDMCAVDRDLPAQQQRYGELRLPLSILYGDSDRTLDWKVHGQGLHAKVPHSRLEVLPGRGHMLPVTAPQETTQWLRQAAGAVFAAAPDTAPQFVQQ